MTKSNNMTIYAHKTILMRAGAKMPSLRDEIRDALTNARGEAYPHFVPERGDGRKRLSEAQRETLREARGLVRCDNSDLIVEALGKLREIGIGAPHEVVRDVCEMCEERRERPLMERVIALMKNEEVRLAAHEFACFCLTETSNYDNLYVDNEAFYVGIRLGLAANESPELWKLCMSECEELSGSRDRNQKFARRACDIGIFNDTHDRLQSGCDEETAERAAAFLLRTVDQTVPPELHSRMLDCVPMLLKAEQTNSGGVVHAGLVLLERLARQTEDADQLIAGVLRDHVIIRSLTSNLESIEDIAILKVIASGASFGDSVIRHMVAMGTLEQIKSRILEFNAPTMWIVIMKLVTEWAVHTTDFVEPLARFVASIPFQTIMESSYELKEASIHAVTVLATRLEGSQLTSTIHKRLLKKVLELAADCEADSCPEYEICHLVWKFMMSAPETTAEVRDMIIQSDVLQKFIDVAAVGQSDASHYARLIVDRVQS